VPELPEVETIVRGLRASLIGERVSGAWIGWPRTVDCPSAPAFLHRLVGRTVMNVTRRGKFVCLGLDEGWLFVHLRMTGRLLLGPGDVHAPWRPYERARLSFGSGLELHFVDVRKFGRLYLVSSRGDVCANLGIEPLDDEFTPEALQRLLTSRRRQLKPLLLDQNVVAGLGNIYVDESLWRAGLHPLRRSDTLTDIECRRLCEATQQVLRTAISDGGTTLRDYRNADNGSGSHGDVLAVYGREGEACRRCGITILRETVGGRGTRYCPKCQPLCPSQETDEGA